MNILISSAGDKRSLIEGFRTVLSALDPSATLIAADSRRDAPSARYVSDFVQQPRDRDPDYNRRWLAICRQYCVGLLVPTRDAELEALSLLQPELAALGVTVLVPKPDALRYCLDKELFHRFCLDHDFPVAPSIGDPGVADLPLFARSATGAGSRHCFAVTSEAELQHIDADMLVQPYCDWPEYSIDTLFSLRGEPLQAVVRERIEVVNGESVVTCVRDIPVLAELALELGRTLGLTGHAVVQCFYQPDKGPLLIECNARFGGASMVSVAAGLASCERILQELAGERDRAFAPRPIVTGELVDRRRRTLGEPL